jgi:hypothetical protein
MKKQNHLVQDVDEMAELAFVVSSRDFTIFISF